jgi:hypothetical protein
MAGWKMIGYARYDYRDWVERHNERYPLPVGISGQSEWGLSRLNLVTAQTMARKLQQLTS